MNTPERGPWKSREPQVLCPLCLREESVLAGGEAEWVEEGEKGLHRTAKTPRPQEKKMGPLPPAQAFTLSGLLCLVRADLSQGPVQGTTDTARVGRTPVLDAAAPRHRLDLSLRICAITLAGHTWRAASSSYLFAAINTAIYSQ